MIGEVAIQLQPSVPVHANPAQSAQSRPVKAFAWLR